MLPPQFDSIAIVVVVASNFVRLRRCNCWGDVVVIDELRFIIAPEAFISCLRRLYKAFCAL